MGRHNKLFGSVFVGMYVWLMAVSFGMTLQDVMYVRLVPDASSAFEQVADFLMKTQMLALVAALGTLLFAKRNKLARRYLLASIVLILIGSWIPMFFGGAGGTGGTPITAGIRIGISGLVSLLALTGMDKFYRQE